MPLPNRSQRIAQLRGNSAGRNVTLTGEVLRNSSQGSGTGKSLKGDDPKHIQTWRTKVLCTRDAHGATLAATEGDCHPHPQTQSLTRLSHGKRGHRPDTEDEQNQLAPSSNPGLSLTQGRRGGRAGVLRRPHRNTHTGKPDTQRSPRTGRYWATKHFRLFITRFITTRFH